MRSAIKRPTEEETNLSGFQLFNKLTEDEFNRLNYEKTCSLYKKGTVIYREGSRLTGFFCVTKVIVKGVKLATIHKKPTGDTPGQIVKVEKPIHVSNVSLMENGKAVKVGFKVENDIKVRISRKTKKKIG